MRILVFSVLALLLLNCKNEPVEQMPVTNPIPGPTNATTLSYLALGDSYTIGEGVSALARWPVLLTGLLRIDSIDVASPDFIAQTGWTTAELQYTLQKSNNQKTYSLVSLLIGVNNQYRGQLAETYRTEFRALLQTAIRFAGGDAKRVFVLSIPDWGYSPFAAGQDRTKITREINQFNAIAQDETQKSGIAFVDITPITRQAAGDASQFADDGLHYSGRQMRLWVEKALPVVKKLVKP